jgi:general secretion pathway protein K
LGEPWAVPLAETRLDDYVENGQAGDDASDAVIWGGVVDAQSRYNLNNLVQNGEVKPEEVAVFDRLLGYLQLNPALAQATADLMAAAQAKSPASEGNTSGSLPMDIAYVDDLLAVPGFTPEILAKLRDYVVVLPGMRKVNVNTASAEVIAARVDTLSLSDAAALVASRENAWFRNTGDFTNSPLLQGKGLGSGEGQIDVYTDYFLVNGNVRLSRAGMEMQALIERTGLDPKVLWIREN